MKPADASRNGRASIVASLKYRNYRLFFSGQSVSLIGTWIQRIAMAWLVYELSGRDKAHALRVLGLQGFLNQIPICVCAPFVGVLVDRLNKHRMLVWTQTAAMTHAAVLATLWFTNTATVWNVLALSVVHGVITSFDMPTRQSFVVTMIDRREDLPNAIALNSFMVNFAKIVGPMLGGLVIVWIDLGWCFLFNSVSYVAVIAGILAMRVQPHQKPTEKRRALQDFREGLSYAAAHVPIRSVMLMVLLVSFVGVPYTDMLPVVADKVFHGDARTLGYLRSAPGVGAVLGVAWLAFRNSAAGLGRAIPVAAATFAIGLLAFTWAAGLQLSLLCLVVAGFGMVIQMASSNTVVQTAVDDDKRGRVMSLYALAMQGSMPFGSLLAGLLAAEIGIPNTLRIAGVITAVGAAVFAWRTRRWGPDGKQFL